ncbi:MAG: hypothetical protein MUE72_02685, partial [Chitinophagaceae bacterium]|nr:hypothetical protein [Chitinophagaceae bacterium]
AAQAKLCNESAIILSFTFWQKQKLFVVVIIMIRKMYLIIRVNQIAPNVRGLALWRNLKNCP